QRAVAGAVVAEAHAVHEPLARDHALDEVGLVAGVAQLAQELARLALGRERRQLQRDVALPLLLVLLRRLRLLVGLRRLLGLGQGDLLLLFPLGLGLGLLRLALALGLRLRLRRLVLALRRLGPLGPALLVGHRLCLALVLGLHQGAVEGQPLL